MLAFETAFGHIGRPLNAARRTPLKLLTDGAAKRVTDPVARDAQLAGLGLDWNTAGARSPVLPGIVLVVTRSGVGRTTITRWERGETCPQPWARPKLARALGISHEALSELLSESAEPEDAASAPAQIVEEVEPLHRRDFLKYSVAFPALRFDELRHLGVAFDDARHYLDAEVESASSRRNPTQLLLRRP